MSIFIEIASTLTAIEAELRRLECWDAEPPSAEALASTEPFCIDTLSFVQWLQFIFLPRMQTMARHGQLPPGRCEIAPLAEEYFARMRVDSLALQRHIGQLDALVNKSR